MFCFLGRDILCVLGQNLNSSRRRIPRPVLGLLYVVCQAAAGSYVDGCGS